MSVGFVTERVIQMNGVIQSTQRMPSRMPVMTGFFRRSLR